MYSAHISGMSVLYNLFRKSPGQLHQVTHSYQMRKKWFLTGIFLLVVLAIECGSTRALPPSPQNAGAGTLDQGITVYWPYHVILMSIGFFLMVTGFFVARFHKTRSWYKTHMILEGYGGACILGGIFVGVYMVTLSGLPQLRNIHEILGGITGILVITTIVLGYSIKHAPIS